MEKVIETQDSKFEIQLRPHLQNLFNSIKSKLDKSKDKYLNKIKEGKKRLEKEINDNLLKISEDVVQVEKLNQNLEEKLEKKLSSDISSKLENLSLKISKTEDIANMAQDNDISKILDVEKLVYIELKEAKDIQSMPAHVIISDYCKFCRGELSWGDRYNSNMFSDCKSILNSNDCNQKLRLKCHECRINFCTVCAYPPYKRICGCKKKMEKLMVYGNSCDLCRASLRNVECWRCNACDFDVCVDCFEKLDEEKDETLIK